MEKTTFRNKTQNGYTVIENELINDPNLSGKAKAILIYLMSKPDGWKAHEIDIAKHMVDGTSAVRHGLKELREKGYLENRPVRSADNTHIAGWETYLLPYSRMRNAKNVESQHSTEPPPIVNKDITITEVLNTPSISPPSDRPEEERGGRSSEIPKSDLESAEPAIPEQQTPEQPPPLSTKPETTETGRTGIGSSAAATENFKHPTQQTEDRFRAQGQLLPWHTSHERFNNLHEGFVSHVLKDLQSRRSNRDDKLPRSRAIRYIGTLEKSDSGLNGLFAMWREYRELLEVQGDSETGNDRSLRS